jgi:hypothetical protein
MAEATRADRPLSRCSAAFGSSLFRFESKPAAGDFPRKGERVREERFVCATRALTIRAGDLDHDFDRAKSWPGARGGARVAIK